MRKRGQIGSHMLYWCEGMSQWEKFQPKKDLEKISAVKRDAYFPFEEGVPPPPPWKKKNMLLRIAVFVALLACVGVFLLAWENHSLRARAEVTKSLMVTSTSEKYRSDIKQGAAYTREQWSKAAAATGMSDMESAQLVLGAPNQINDDGYRWIYFDRMLHPVTGMQTDMSVRFDNRKNIVGFEPFP